VKIGTALMRGTGKPMQVVKKVCHNGADNDSAIRKNCSYTVTIVFEKVDLALLLLLDLLNHTF
jgi:hypothetical protein